MVTRSDPTPNDPPDSDQNGPTVPRPKDRETPYPPRDSISSKEEVERLLLSREGSLVSETCWNRHLSCKTTSVVPSTTNWCDTPRRQRGYDQMYRVRKIKTLVRILYHDNSESHSLNRSQIIGRSFIIGVPSV